MLPLCTDWIDIWEPQPPGTLRACPGLYRDYYILAYICIYIRYCGGNVLVGRDAVYSGSTRYSVKLADCMISVKEYVVMIAQVSLKRR